MEQQHRKETCKTPHLKTSAVIPILLLAEPRSETESESDEGVIILPVEQIHPGGGEDTTTSGWSEPGGNPLGAPPAAQHGGASWPGMGGVSSPGSGGYGAPAAASSPGPDYSAYHQYYQQYAA